MCCSFATQCCSRSSHVFCDWDQPITLLVCNSFPKLAAFHVYACTLKYVSCPHRATTHTDLELRARVLSIPTKVIHNASIMNAIGACGLQLYRFGEVGRTEPM